MTESKINYAISNRILYRVIYPDESYILDNPRRLTILLDIKGRYARSFYG